jgi:NADH-quinone oxidoreductase subunit L
MCIRDSAWFDQTVVDGIVNGTATVTRGLAVAYSKFDSFVVDGFVNFMAYLSGIFGLLFRKLQNGRVQTYVALVVFSVIVLLFIFKPF